VRCIASCLPLLTLSSSYKQALASALSAHDLASTHGLPFTRPSDYFAEMVKSDAHMERIRQRLLDERVGMKRSEEKRKEREGKKFGKQVQLEKLKEREKGKKEMEERLKGLKRSKSFHFVIIRKCCHSITRAVN
jgi:rRNA-processing protein EBP2